MNSESHRFEPTPVEQLQFPATPEEMDLVLEMEDIAKCDGKLDDGGMHAHVIMTAATTNWYRI